VPFDQLGQTTRKKARWSRANNQDVGRQHFAFSGKLALLFLGYPVTIPWL